MRVYRGIGIKRAARSIAMIAFAYGGVLAAAWALGLVVYGWRGWLVVLTPLAAWIGARAMSWQRVSAEIEDGVLRYEGAAREDDFEIALDRICAVERDARGVVLTVEGKRVRAELSPRAAEALEQAIRSSSSGS